MIEPKHPQDPPATATLCTYPSARSLSQPQPHLQTRSDPLLPMAMATMTYSHPYPDHHTQTLPHSLSHSQTQSQTMDYVHSQQQSHHIPFTNQLAYQSTFTPEGFNFESPFVFNNTQSNSTTVASQPTSHIPQPQPLPQPDHVINYGMMEPPWGNEQKKHAQLTRPGINLATGDRFSQLLEQKLGLDQQNQSPFLNSTTPVIPSQTNNHQGFNNQQLVIENALHDFSQVTIPPDFVAPVPSQYSWGMGPPAPQVTSIMGSSSSRGDDGGVPQDLMRQFSSNLTSSTYNQNQSQQMETYNPNLTIPSGLLPANPHLQMFSTSPSQMRPPDASFSGSKMRYSLSTKSWEPAQRSYPPPYEDLPPLLKIRVHTPDVAPKSQQLVSSQQPPAELTTQTRLSALSPANRHARARQAGQAGPSSTTPPNQHVTPPEPGSWALELLSDPQNAQDNAWGTIPSSASLAVSPLPLQSHTGPSYTSASSSPLAPNLPGIGSSSSPVLPPATQSVQSVQSAQASHNANDAKRRLSKGKAKAVVKQVTPERENKSEELDSAASNNGGGGPEKKIIIACHTCRARKLKCDGARPKCHHCSRRNEDSCVYDAVLRRRGPGKHNKKKKRGVGGESEDEDDENPGGDGEEVQGARKRRRRRKVEISMTTAAAAGNTDGGRSSESSGNEQEIGVDHMGIGPGGGLGSSGHTHTQAQRSDQAIGMSLGMTMGMGIGGMAVGMGMGLGMDDPWSGPMLGRQAQQQGYPPVLPSSHAEYDERASGRFEMSRARD